MTKVKKVIFVSCDNTCLGPAAESIFKRIGVNYEVEAISRGLVVLFPEPLNTKMLSVMEKHGLIPEKEFSEQLEKTDLTENCLILTMTEGDLQMVQEMYPDVNAQMLRKFVGQKGDVEIPLGGSLADYEACYEHIDLLTKMAAEIIFKEEES